MSEKNIVKVVIDGRSIRLGGYESADYLERVAFYINHKMAEMHDTPGFNRQKPEMKSILLALNIADDYFKAKIRADMLEGDIESKDQEAYAIKQDLVAAQVKIQKLERQLAAYKQTYSPMQVEMDVEDGTRPAVLKPDTVFFEKQDQADPVQTKEEPGIPRKEEPEQEKAAEETAEHSGQIPEKEKKTGNEKYLKRSQRYLEKMGKHSV